MLRRDETGSVGLRMDESVLSTVNMHRLPSRWMSFGLAAGRLIEKSVASRCAQTDNEADPFL